MAAFSTQHFCSLRHGWVVNRALETLTPSQCLLQTALVVPGVAALISQPRGAQEAPVSLPSLCAVLKVQLQ